MIIAEEVGKAVKPLINEIHILRGKLEEVQKAVKDADNNKRVTSENIERNGTERINKNVRITYVEIANSSKKEEIIIQPIREQTSEETVGTIKSNVNIMELVANVNNIVNGSNGKIILECQKKIRKYLQCVAIKDNLVSQYKIYAPHK